MALESCVGGALDPGIEVSRAVLFNDDRYLPGEPFRLSPAAVRPGDVTQYNAVPWQADFLACQWEELDGPWPRRLGWWPAQRPDDVYPHPTAHEMVPWTRGLGDDYQDMVDHWDRLGIVVNHGSRGVPCSAWVITAPPDFAPGIKNLITLSYPASHFDSRRLLSDPVM